MPIRPRDILLFVLTLVPRDALPKRAKSDMAEILHRPIRSLTFPENSNMGIFVALAVPLEDPLNSVSLSYFFEANYVLPPNITYLEPWALRKRRRRNIDRTTIYRVLESKFESSGYPGRECLLRAICETSEHPIRHNGMIGDIVHVIFTCSWKRITALALLACLAKSMRVAGLRNITRGVSRHVRSIGFPEGSNTGIFFALGIPVDIPDKSVSLSFYFEANYGLPFEWNSSYFDEGGHFARRSLSRQLVYRVFMSKMESLGYPGLDCLLKTICDVARYSLRENGVLGDIFQIVFTPSMSRNENLPSQITEAEQEQNCDQRYKKCSVNLLDLISH